MTTRRLPDDPLQVRADEFGLVRLFSSDLDASDASNITAKNVARLLGKDIELDPSKLEVVSSKAIAALGLSAYLREGYGITGADLDGKSAALDALSGLIVLIPSSAFGGTAQELEPHDALRLIGVFREESATPPVAMAGSASGHGTLPTPEAPPPAPDTLRGRGWIGALGALLIAAALVLYVVF